MAVLDQAAVTDYHNVGALSKHLFLTVLEAVKPKTKVPAELVLAGALFLVCRGWSYI